MQIDNFATVMVEHQQKKIIFIQLIVPGIIGFLVYANTLEADFVYDDK